MKPKILIKTAGSMHFYYMKVDEFNERTKLKTVVTNGFVALGWYSPEKGTVKLIAYTLIF